MDYNNHNRHINPIQAEGGAHDPYLQTSSMNHHDRSYGHSYQEGGAERPHQQNYEYGLPVPDQLEQNSLHYPSQPQNLYNFSLQQTQQPFNPHSFASQSPSPAFTPQGPPRIQQSSLPIAHSTPSTESTRLARSVNTTHINAELQQAEDNWKRISEELVRVSDEMDNTHDEEVLENLRMRRAKLEKELKRAQKTYSLQKKMVDKVHKERIARDQQRSQTLGDDGSQAVLSGGNPQLPTATPHSVFSGFAPEPSHQTIAPPSFLPYDSTQIGQHYLTAATTAALPDHFGHQHPATQSQQQNPFHYPLQQQNLANDPSQQPLNPPSFASQSAFNTFPERFPQQLPPPHQSAYPVYSTPSVYSTTPNFPLSTTLSFSSGAAPTVPALEEDENLRHQIRIAQGEVEGRETDVENAQKEYDTLADALNLDGLYREMLAEPAGEKRAVLEAQYEQAKNQLKNSGSTRTRRQKRLERAREKLSKLTGTNDRELTGTETSRKDDLSSLPHSRLHLTLLPRKATSAHSSETFAQYPSSSATLDPSSLDPLTTDQRFHARRRSPVPPQRQRHSQTELATLEEARKKLLKEVTKAKGAVERSQGRVNSYLLDVQKRREEIAELEKEGRGRNERESLRRFTESLEGKVETLNQCEAKLRAAEVALVQFDRKHGIVSSVRKA